MRTIIDPPENAPAEDGSVAGGWWHDAEEGRIVCDLCPRECHLKPGDRGFCFVRQNVEGEMRLITYGRSTGFCIDPIEKKPLNHFYPGTSVLSFGTAGCNLGCKFCQNWDISKSREVERLSEYATPEMIAEAARRNGCASVAFTYNDPIIWAEYAIDTARACRAAKIKTVAVTAGYISPAVREPFFHAMDAANVDLKAFTEDFYHKITYSHLQPVLDTLHWLKHESDVWFEITNLVIPDANDSPDEIRQMCDWILKSVGPDVPIHFSAFHPDFRMTDQPRTPHETLIRSREIAMQQGLRFVYVGNVNDVANQSTWCPGCGTLLIERNYYELGQWNLRHSACAKCGEAIPGEFSDQPGTWGSRRLPIRISDYKPSANRSETRQEFRQPKENVAESLDDFRYERVSEQPVIAPGIRKEPELTTSQEAAIHRAACETVAAASLRQQPHLTDTTLSGAADKIVMGVFVTLKRNGQLRGCIGSLGEPMPLLPALMRSATRTTLEDHRFLPVAPSELAGLTLDVSLLFNFEDVLEIGEARIDAVEVGKHGLKIVQGDASGLLLPVVAIENKWDAGTFLEQV